MGNFDEDFEDFELGNNEEETTFESDLDGFESDGENEENDVVDSNIKKSTIIAITIAIIIIILAIVGYNIGNSWLSRRGNNAQETTNEQQVEEVQVIEQVQTVNNSSNTGSTEWTEIGDSEQVLFAGERVESMFTVTKIRHLARVTSGEIEIKTELTGTLSGYTGTYKLYVPYDKGTSINVGNSFKVSLLVGEYGENTVIGDIDY